MCGQVDGDRWLASEAADRHVDGHTSQTCSIKDADALTPRMHRATGNIEWDTQVHGAALLTRTSSRRRPFIFNPNEEKYTASVRALLTEQASAPAVAKCPLRRYQPCQPTGPQARTVNSVRQAEQVGG